MALYRYPQNDLDKPELLLELLGSFWATTYQGNGLIEDLAGAVGRATQQTYLELLDLLASCSRFDVPVFRCENWYALRVLESEINTDSSLLLKYTTPATANYNAVTELQYGIGQQSDYYSVAKPTDLVDVRLILSRMTSSAVELVAGVDFWLQSSVITFRDNPFNNTKIAKREILDETGRVKDRELTLWLYRGQWDLKLVYEQFGYALRLHMQSSEGYKQLINAIFDAFVEGTSVRSQQLALSAIYGVPLVMEHTETVEKILKDADKLNIITDSHVYQFPLLTQATVAVGDVLHAGDPLTDLFEIFEFNRGKQVPANKLQGITLGPGVLACGFWDEITFDNTTVPLVVESNVDGYTKVSWQLGGFPADVEKFWADVHSDGVVAGKTLAMLLDVRPNPVDQPTAEMLPEVVNPLQFLIDNVFRSNVFVVKVKKGSQLTNKLAFVPVEQLRKMQPPQTLMLLIVELVHSDSPVIMETSGTALNPGYEEEVNSFLCIAVSEAVVPADAIVEEVNATTIGGRCI